MTKYFARIKPTSPVKNYRIITGGGAGSIRFSKAEQGQPTVWHEITAARAEELKAGRLNPDAPDIFDVYTEAEKAALEAREAEAKRRAEEEAKKINPATGAVVISEAEPEPVVPDAVDVALDAPEAPTATPEKTVKRAGSLAPPPPRRKRE